MGFNSGFKGLSVKCDMQSNLHPASDRCTRICRLPCIKEGGMVGYV